MELSIVTYFLMMLVLFQFKHFFADYIFQTKYMLGKFKESGWVKPLTAHCLVHASATFAICFGFMLEWHPNAFGAALLFGLFDFMFHFTMDRIKASPNLLGGYTPKQKAFWVTLGVDQMVHHLTHYMIIIGMICFYLDSV